MLVGTIEVDVTTSLAAHMATLTSLLKTMALNNGALAGNANQLNALNQVAAISYV